MVAAIPKIYAFNPYNQSHRELSGIEESSQIDEVKVVFEKGVEGMQEKALGELIQDLCNYAVLSSVVATSEETQRRWHLDFTPNVSTGKDFKYYQQHLTDEEEKTGRKIVDFLAPKYFNTSNVKIFRPPVALGEKGKMSAILESIKPIYRKRSGQ